MTLRPARPLTTQSIHMGSATHHTPTTPHGLTSRLLLLLVRIVGLMPFRLLYALSDLLYLLVYRLAGYRRGVVRRNLTEAFPEKSLREIMDIERGFYHYFTDMMVESCKLLTISHEEMMRRMTFSGVDTVNTLLAQGKSVALYLGHYGNWEWITSVRLWLHKDAVPAQIYHKLSNEAMDRTMLTLRERMGSVCIDMYQTVRYMAQAARSGKPHIIGFIADQSPKRREAHHFIPFLHHHTPVLTGTEKATKHFDYAAFFVGVRRLGRGRYTCELSPLHPDPKTLPDFELTSLYFRRLEQQIRECPELYLWTHKRFRYATKLP